MNHGKLSIAILTLAAALVACNNGRKTEVAVSSSVEQPGTVDNETSEAALADCNSDTKTKVAVTSSVEQPGTVDNETSEAALADCNSDTKTEDVVTNSVEQPKTVDNEASATVLTASNNGSKTEVAIPSSIKLPGTVDNEAFAANVESISVMNLQLDDDWSVVQYPELAIADNYIFVIQYEQLKLICFDKQTGERVSSRSIKGNGPGEITSLTTKFCIGDTLFVQGSWYKVLSYNKDCKYLGMVHEFKDDFFSYKIVPLAGGKFALVSPQHPRDAKSILLTDHSFNIKSEHFDTPSFRMYVASSATAPFYSVGDTVRFFYCCDNHLYTLCGNTEHSTEFVMPNPLTPEIATKEQDKIFEYKYDGLFGDLAGSGRFVHFSYILGKEKYSTLLDKRTNSVISANYEKQKQSTSGFVIDFFRKGTIMVTDGKYIYSVCKNSQMAEILEGHDNLLDARLQKTQAEYRAYLKRNAEYLKDLDSDERDAANVLLKIKLKD